MCRDRDDMMLGRCWGAAALANAEVVEKIMDVPVTKQAPCSVVTLLGGAQLLRVPPPHPGASRSYLPVQC